MIYINSLMCVMFVMTIAAVPTRKELLQAVKDENLLEQVRTMLEEAEKADNLDDLLGRGSYYQEMPLHAAAEKGNVEIIKLLVDKGAALEAQDEDGKNAYEIALNAGHDHHVTRYLDGSNPIHWAIYDKSLSALEEAVKNHKKDINDRMMIGLYTPLHVAVKVRDSQLVHHLLEQRANPNMQDRYGGTPLHVAVEDKNISIIKDLIMHDADPEIENYVEENSLNLAFNNNVDLKYLTKNPLLWAVIEKNKNDFDAHVQDKGYREKKDRAGNTPLHVAVEAGQKDMVQSLIANKVNVNVANNTNITPLMKAAQLDDVAILQLLLNVGASIGNKDVIDNTALVHAVKADNVPAMKLLIAKGAALDVKDDEANTLLHIAAGSGAPNALQYLSEKGLKIDEKNRKV